MGKTHQYLFSANRNLFTLVLAAALLHGLGHGVGLRIDQGAALRALRHGRRAADEQWTVEGLTGEIGQSFDDGKMEDDAIEGGLPGQPLGVTFKQYAGYVTVDKAKGRSLFYYFAEAVHSPSAMPLVLWLNGGPGCSSLGVGAMVEIGPFGVKPDSRTLYLRRHAWNGVANLLFLESPAGVGFSYSNSSSDYSTTGDTRTAQDTYSFLINWFRRYPRYKDRDFYIMGESYSGFYIPELADYIMKMNMHVDTSSRIQLKGIMIGNGIMNDATDQKGMYDFLWSHALISDETHRGLVEHCSDLSNTNPCDEFETKIGSEIGLIDFYNIYSPVCFDSSLSLKKPKRLHGYDPCEENYVEMYLNLPQVQQALHANTTKLPYTWDFCSHLIQTWKDRPSTVLPIYKRLIASGLKILLYSGDVDSVVPVSGTRYSIDVLDLKVIKPWHPWLDDNKEVGGYKVVYDGLTFTTVRGAGHEVPRFQPGRALAVLKMFVAGEDY